MNQKENKSTFLIKSSTNGSFGTGFVMSVDEKGSYLVTCCHVIEECGETTLLVASNKVNLVHKGSSDEIDLAVIYVEGLVDTEVLTACIDSVNENLLVEINGFKPYKKESPKFEKLGGAVKKISEIYTPRKNMKIYELTLEEGDKIEKGYSGAAVLLEGTNTVIAVATNRNQNGKDAYAIPISYLKDIWETMPNFLASEKEMKYKGKEKISFWKKMENQALNTIIGTILLGLLTGYLYDFFGSFNVIDTRIQGDKVPLKSVNSQISILNGNENNVTQIMDKCNKSINVQTIKLNGNKTIIIQKMNIDNDIIKYCKKGMSTYQKTIDEFNEELRIARMSESKKIINRDLLETKKQLREFKKDCQE